VLFDSVNVTGNIVAAPFFTSKSITSLIGGIRGDSNIQADYVEIETEDFIETEVIEYGNEYYDASVTSGVVG